MPRTALRTKDGCLRCKKRRIKCDEEKPICNNCARWGFECLWPAHVLSVIDDPLSEPADYDEVRNRRSPSLSTYQTDVLTNGVKGFESETQLVLVKNAVEFLGVYPFFPTNPQPPNFCMTLALESEMVRVAASTLSTASLAKTNPEMQLTALRTCQQALHDLKIHLSRCEGGVQEMQALTCIVFLGFAELFGNSEPQAAATHLAVVASQAASYQRLSTRGATDSMNRWRKHAIELALHACGVIAILDYRLASMFNKDDWHCLKDFLLPQPADALVECEPTRNTLRLHLNSITWWQLHLSHLSTGAMPFPHVQIEVESLSRELGGSQLRTIPVDLPNTSWGDVRNVNPVFNILRNLLHIWSTAISDLNSCSNIDSVRNALRIVTDLWIHLPMEGQRDQNTWLMQPPEIRSLYAFTDFRMGSNLATLWVVIVAVCASHEMSEMDFFSREMTLKYSDIDPGVLSQMQRLVLVLRHRKQQNLPCTRQSAGACSGRHDGLDILRRMDRFFSNKDFV